MENLSIKVGSAFSTSAECGKGKDVPVEGNVRADLFEELKKDGYGEKDPIASIRDERLQTLRDAVIVKKVGDLRSLSSILGKGWCGEEFPKNILVFRLEHFPCDKWFSPHVNQMITLEPYTHNSDEISLRTAIYPNVSFRKDEAQVVILKKDGTVEERVESDLPSPRAHRHSQSCSYPCSCLSPKES